MLPLILALLPALGLSAFFTAAELAVFSLGDSRIRTLSDEGFRGSGALVALRARPQRVLVLVRLGDAVADAAAAILVGYAGFAWWGVQGLVAAIAIAGLLIVFLGELLPLQVAAKHGVRIALGTAPVLLATCRVLGPVLAILERLAEALPERPAAAVGDLTESEIRQLTALGHTEGVIEDHERQLIERAFRLDETKAWDIMTPRVDIFAWPDALRLADIATDLRTVPYSRVPIYGESIDDITGILYLRDAYQALVAGQRDVYLRELAREPLIVPGSVPLSKLLRDFQTRRIHLALVVDEYGGTDGLVTLEDVLEELVGEIVDETDVAEEPITRVSRHEILAAGDADLREINHVLNTSFPQLEHRSLNGYLLEKLGRVPATGEVHERDGIMIEVVEATETQVLRARLRRTAPLPETGAEDTRRQAADGGTSPDNGEADTAGPDSGPATGGGATSAVGDEPEAREGGLGAGLASPSRARL